mmetsp:Transcript_20633/g.39821  ORF Transcript_20633/g.39821 Transcript_20633/m.39821 type:complete len:338 (-) Transcript_20633:164-1177(-)
MSDYVPTGAFYAEYHGHLISHLKVLREGLKGNGAKSLIYLAGDSSLDNKHWLFPGPKQHADYNDDSFTGAAINGYEKILRPPRMVKDVAYWLNYEISKSEHKEKVACINCSIEESALGERDGGVLLPQDKFILDNIAEDDILVISVGGNDIALKPTCCTIWNMAILIFCSCTCCIESACGCTMPCCGCGFPCGLGHFLHMFKVKVEDFVKRLTAKKKPKKVIVCMIYFLDEKPGESWVEQTLALLGYNNNPRKLQTLIRKVYALATKKIHVEGVEVEAYPLFKVLDGKNTDDYDNRCEPSVQGGAKMGSAFFRTIFGEEQKKGDDLCIGEAKERKQD